MKFTTDELRSVTILEGLADPQLAWFADHGEKIELAEGDHLFESGQPSDFMFIIVKGTIQRYQEIGEQWLLAATTQQGEVTGILPYSRMTQYPGYTVATEASQVLRLKKTHPCGSNLWEVARLGADIGIRCQRCQRYVLIQRSYLERRVKEVLGRQERGGPSTSSG